MWLEQQHCKYTNSLCNMGRCCLKVACAVATVQYNPLKVTGAKTVRGSPKILTKPLSRYAA